MADSPEAVLLAEARRALDNQVLIVDALQTKAMTVFAAGGIIAGLAAPRAFAPKVAQATTILAYIALGFFALGASIAIDIIRPRSWRFGQKLPGQLDWLDKERDKPSTERDFTVKLAVNLDRDWQFNDCQLKRLNYEFVVQLAMLLAQVVCWSLAYILA